MHRRKGVLVIDVVRKLFMYIIAVPQLSSLLLKVGQQTRASMLGFTILGFGTQTLISDSIKLFRPRHTTRLQAVDFSLPSK